MNLHQDHVIVEGVGGWHCQTCADQAATEAALRNEIARLKAEIQELKYPTRYHDVEEYYRQEQIPPKTYYLNGALCVECGGTIPQGQICATA